MVSSSSFVSTARQLALITAFALSSVLTSQQSLTMAQDSGKQVGVDICACQPDVITITFNFSLICDESNVNGPGIVESTCKVDSRNSNVNSTLVPVSVTEVQFLELNQDKQVFAQSSVKGPFQEGEDVTYTSVVKSSGYVLNSTSLPLGFQITISALNEAEEALTQITAILYANDCGIFPLLEVGEHIGWAVFVSARCRLLGAANALSIAAQRNHDKLHVLTAHSFSSVQHNAPHTDRFGCTRCRCVSHCQSCRSRCGPNGSPK
jgi:hypothetical protein